MPLQNSSGPFSRNTPRDVSGRPLTNPGLFGIPDRQEKDNLIDPKLTSEDIAKGDLRNLYISSVVGFRNTPYEVSWRTMNDLRDHANMHVKNNTFGTKNLDPKLADEGLQKLLVHQELMYDGLLAGMSFLEAHKYALKLGPAPVK